MTPLLVCLAAIIVLVIVVCAAVRICDLDHVDLNANLLKFAAVSFSVKSRPPRRSLGTGSPVPKQSRR
ncbi:hypothetical protein [Mycobacterium colombiense]|uniref:hypothetical protein n=1 Tax=Mycobacterium colombiense TaxID=339268 RepID=UPI0012DB1F3F|nr:hypothetical protein [Mycobacterium colombiense]